MASYFVSLRKSLSLLLGLALLGAVALYIDDQLSQKELVPVQFVRLEGNLHYIDREEIKTELEPLLSGGLLNLDMAEISRAIEALSWVASVRLTRIWPDILQVELQEQVPYLRWGLDSYLNEEGERFDSAGRDVSERLPVIFASNGQEKRLLVEYEKLVKRLSRQEMELKEFHVTDRQAWQLLLGNEMEVLLGRDKPLEVFGRLIKSVARLGDDQLQRIVRIDMRYPNGFAVQWKESEQEKVGINSFLQDRENA